MSADRAVQLLKKDDVNVRTIQAFCYGGISDEHRSTLWSIMLGSMPVRASERAKKIEQHIRLYESYVRDVFDPSSPSRRSKTSLLMGKSDSQNSLTDASVASEDSYLSDSTYSVKDNNLGDASSTELTAGDVDAQEPFPPYMDVDLSQPLGLRFTAADEELRISIAKDVPRIHPDIPWFCRSVQMNSLRRILFVWAKLNVGVGYVQGMHELLAPIFYVTSTAEYDEMGDPTTPALSEKILPGQEWCERVAAFNAAKAERERQRSTVQTLGNPQSSIEKSKANSDFPQDSSADAGHGPNASSKSVSVSGSSDTHTSVHSKASSPDSSAIPFEPDLNLEKNQVGSHDTIRDSTSPLSEGSGSFPDPQDGIVVIGSSSNEDSDDLASFLQSGGYILEEGEELPSPPLSEEDKVRLFHAEAKTFFAFCELLAETRDLFIQAHDNTDSGIKSTLDRLKRLISRREPEITAHLEELKLEPMFFAFRWVTTLFFRDILFLDVLKLWDSFFADPNRFDFLHYSCVAYLRLRRKEILTSDFAHTMNILTDTERWRPPIQDLISTAEEIRSEELLDIANRAAMVLTQSFPSKSSSFRVGQESSSNKSTLSRKGSDLTASSVSVEKNPAAFASPTANASEGGDSLLQQWAGWGLSTIRSWTEPRAHTNETVAQSHIAEFESSRPSASTAQTRSQSRIGNHYDSTSEMAGQSSSRSAYESRRNSNIVTSAIVDDLDRMAPPPPQSMDALRSRLPRRQVPPPAPNTQPKPESQGLFRRALGTGVALLNRVIDSNSSTSVSSVNNEALRAEANRQKFFSSHPLLTGALTSTGFSSTPSPSREKSPISSSSVPTELVNLTSSTQSTPVTSPSLVASHAEFPIGTNIPSLQPTRYSPFRPAPGSARRRSAIFTPYATAERNSMDTLNDTLFSDQEDGVSVFLGMSDIPVLSDDVTSPDQMIMSIPPANGGTVANGTRLASRLNSPSREPSDLLNEEPKEHSLDAGNVSSQSNSVDTPPSTLSAVSIEDASALKAFMHGVIHRKENDRRSLASLSQADRPTFTLEGKSDTNQVGEIELSVSVTKPDQSNPSDNEIALACASTVMDSPLDAVVELPRESQKIDSEPSEVVSAIVSADDVSSPSLPISPDALPY